MRRHVTLSAFGGSPLASAGVDEQSHQTLMCKSNNSTEVQRASVKLERKTAAQQKPGPAPIHLSQCESIRQSIRMHYITVSPPLAKITQWRQIVSYERPERYHVEN